MKILNFEAENVKRLRAVEITPAGNLVEITGRNGQGKTSVLDAIWWALSGTKHIQAEPIRKGAKEARIRLDLGEIIVTRTFRRKGDEQPSNLTVESAEGARFPSPQEMLNSLVSSLSFDPLAFTRLDAKGKFDALKRFVPDVDFEETAAKNRIDFQTRTDINRRAKEADAAADSIKIPVDTPEELIDETALIAALEEAGETNRKIDQRAARREQVAADAARMRNAAQASRARAQELRAEAATHDEHAAAHDKGAEDIEARLAEVEALPPHVSTTEIRDQIEKARLTNAAVAKRKERNTLYDRAEDLVKQSEALTEKMAARTKAMQDAIAAAEMPIPGLAFGDGEVLLNDVPFEQASDADQLRASIALAMAANPKLRVIRVRDGSLLDEDSMRIVAEMAAEKDCQVWIETVGGTGPAAIVIEDGAVKKPVAQAAE